MVTDKLIRRNVNWDYLGHGISSDRLKHSHEMFTQKDWNQTLITNLNMVGVEIKKKKGLDGPFNVMVPSKFSNIIRSLEYYKEGMITSKYKVELINSDSNKIKVDDYTITIINFRP